MTGIRQDFSALKQGARDWMQEFDKRLVVLEQTTNADLYNSLASLYMFHKTWTDTEANKKKYLNLFKGSYINSPGTGYTALIKLVFFSKPETAMEYRSKIAKWNGALSQLGKEKIATEVAARARFTKDGVAKLYATYTKNKGSGGGSGGSGGTTKLDKGKAELLKALADAPVIETDHVQGDFAAEKFALALVRVSKTRGEMKILKVVAQEEDAETQRHIKKEAPASEKSAAKPFALLNSIIRFSDVVKPGGKGTHAIHIDNSGNLAAINVGRLESKDSIVAQISLPTLDALPKKTFAIYKDEGDGLKHLWGSASTWEWETVNKGASVEGTKMPAPAIVLANGKVSDWIAKQTQKIRKAPKADPTATYAKKKFITYLKTHMAVTLAAGLGRDKQARPRPDLSYHSVNATFDKDSLTAYLDWAKGNEEASGEKQLMFNGGKLELTDKNGRVVYTFDCAVSGSPAKSDKFGIKTRDLTKVLKAYKTIKKFDVRVNFAGSAIRFSANGEANAEWNVWVPTLGWAGYKTDHIAFNNELGG